MTKNNSKERRIYFDWAACAPETIRSRFSFIDGNPSSQHAEGRAAKLALESARERAASVLNVPPESLYFTSGGTESNSIALFSNLTRPGKGQVISSMGEHASIREGMETLVKMGKSAGKIKIDSTGRVTRDTLKKALSQYDDTRFAAVMSVNNETGAVTDIASLTEVMRNCKAPVHIHCDIVQAAGKIPVDLKKWDIDSASISAHKISGPRGIGLLYLRKPVEVFYSGGGQERGIRGGTENTRGAAALADCLELAVKGSGDQRSAIEDRVSACGRQEPYRMFSGVEDEYIRAKARWKKLITSLLSIKRCTLIPKERTADDDRFSPYILQVAFNDIPGEVMARALDDLGFAVSTGSACSSSSPERPVLEAMGIDEKLRIEGIRISQGQSTTGEEIDLLLEGISEVLRFL
ncbi:MAG: aminotransferase class V-fold PLP-dependent enzyme [Treponema sp.]|jgi:cysteine desulfurase|nr:aminotransferase class V-fold PLP-dependent enzyme [Treponema sp.]